MKPPKHSQKRGQFGGSKPCFDIGNTKNRTPTGTHPRFGTPNPSDKVTVLTLRLAKIPRFKGGYLFGGSPEPLKTGVQPPKNETGLDRDKMGVWMAIGTPGWPQNGPLRPPK